MKYVVKVKIHCGQAYGVLREVKISFVRVSKNVWKIGLIYNMIAWVKGCTKHKGERAFMNMLGVHLFGLFVYVLIECMPSLNK